VPPPRVVVIGAVHISQALAPIAAIVTNVEADHLDIYGTLDAVVHSFRDFAALLPARAEGGRLYINHDGAHRREVAAGAQADIQTVGFAPDADWNVRYDPQSRKVDLTQAGTLVATCERAALMLGKPT
jgi:UDP-N-acetylmuramate--alanine ligase